jgi:hypothetical protein
MQIHKRSDRNARMPLEPIGIEFLQSVGIGIGSMQKVRFSFGIGIGFGIQKGCWDL